MKLIYRIVGYATIIGALCFVVLPALMVGCKSPTQTAYVAESAGYVTLKTVADEYKLYKASHTIDPITDAKIHSLYASAKAAELTAIDVTEAAAGFSSTTNSITPAAANAAAAATFTDLITFLKSIGVKL